MIIYSNTLENFRNDCNGTVPPIGMILRSRFEEKHISGGQDREYKSWINSLPELAKALDDSSLDPNIGVGVEYKLIDTKQRIDFLLYGLDECNKENVIVIELKQWSEARRSNLQDCVYTFGGRGDDDYWHPSYQAFNYANIMKYFNQYVYDNKVNISACSFLHNMPEYYDSIFEDTKIFPLVIEAPAFLKDDKQRLIEFIKKFIRKPCLKGKDTLYEIDQSNIVPSKEFANMVYDAIKGEPFFTYDKEQAFSVSKIVSEVNEALAKNERRTLIVRGGPGSGKSIVAINALGQLMNPKDGSRRKNACYVTATFTPRTYYSEILTGQDFTKKAIAELFKSPAVCVKAPANSFDCIIVDEAHRMFSWKYGMGVGRDVDIIDKLFNASRVNVFFIDEDQMITTTDFLSISKIKEYAAKYGSKVIEDDRMILSSQFRCVGGEQYIEFINNLLEFPNEFNSIKKIHYQVKCFDSIGDMMREVNKINSSGTHEVRLMAGYTHEWVSKTNPNLYDFSYPQDNVYLRWNIRKADRAAVLDKDQINNVFCVHTIQGLEVEYAAVIIGKDLTYDEEKGCLVFHKEQIAKSDRASGIRTTDDETAKKLIRNSYKVLLSRGVKGTFIYAEDPVLRKHIKDLMKM